MADPTPRSYEDCFGDIADGFLSKTGLSTLKAAGPIMSFIEATAQSQTRGSEDTFGLLKSSDLNETKGNALLRIGLSEGVPIFGKKSATTTLTVGDSSFLKIAAAIYAGAAAPIAGTTAIKVADASTFPGSGSVYLGRGTTQYEGPIAYASTTNVGPYWTINLSTPTLRFHNLGESVILAQGGDRAINPGLIAQTASGDPASAVQFKTTAPAKILDGEVSVSGVAAVAQQSGTAGNVQSGAINSWKQGPFNGATVTNPSPITNGREQELDDDYRDRIRQARTTRAAGTPLALKTKAIGVLAPDEPKQSLATSLASEGDGAFTLYTDDGTGYEEVDVGVAIEVLQDDAVGGERSFALSRFPVAKPQLTSGNQSPYVLYAGARLAFSVDGTVTEHAFSVTDARSIGSAATYDVVASVNADPNLLWSMRTAQGGTVVVAFPRSRTAGSITLSTATINDVAGVFSFTSTPSFDVRLYEDDLPLNEFGKVARVLSQPFANWAGITGSPTLILLVDGVQLTFDGSQFPAFSSADFVAAKTGYSSVGPNSPAAWAAVFSYRIPGVTASIQNGLLALDSNRGTSGLASVQILGGTLAASMFTVMAQSTMGAASDFTLDRNTGEIVLARPLTTRQTLSAGSLATRAFVQSSVLAPQTLAANGNLWFSVDGNESFPPSGITASTGIDVTSPAASTWFRIRLASNAGSALFTSILMGDQVVFWDPAMVALGLSGTYRVSRVDAAGVWFEVASVTTITPGTNVLPTKAGIQFVRSSRILQKLTVPSGAGYTATSFAAALAPVGAIAATRRTSQLRVSTNTQALSGSLALAAEDTAGLQMGLPRAVAFNQVGQVASIISTGSEVGFPDFHQAFLNNMSGAVPVFAWSPDPASLELAPSMGGPLIGLRSQYISGSISQWGNNQGFSTFLRNEVTAGGNLWTMASRLAPEVAWTPTADRVAFCYPFAFSWDDQLAVLVDEDASTKRFVIPAWRRVRPTTGTYGSTNAFTDLDNGNGALGLAFGPTFDFNDWAIYMPARVITDSADATRSVLWRWYRPGPDGERAQLTYGLPSAPSLGVSVTIDGVVDTTFLDVTVNLAGGALSASLGLRASTNWGLVQAAPVSGIATSTAVLGYAISAAQRAGNVTTLTLVLPAGVTDHGLSGSYCYVKSTDVNFPSGSYYVGYISSTTLIYADPGANVGPDVNIGTISNDPNGEATFNNLSPALTVGQYLRIDLPAVGLSPYIGQTFRVTGSGPQYVQFKCMGFTGGANTVTSWNPLNDPLALKVFANANQTVGTIVAAVNALTTTTGGGKVPITAVSTGTGLGVTVRSSADLANVYPTWFSFQDGLNYVDLTTPAASPANYQLSFKGVPSGALATGSDWANETCYLVPRSAKNVADWASAPAFSGLFTSADVKQAGAGRKLQLSSLTVGSTGAVRCQGGTANAVSFPLVGSRVGTNTNTPSFQAVSALTTGAHGGQLALFQNATPSPKGAFDLSTALTSIAVASGVATVTVSGTPVWNQQAGPTIDAEVVIERVGEAGNLVMITDHGAAFLPLGSIVEGSWIRISQTGGPLFPSTQILSQNTGIFRVVRVVSPGIDGAQGAFWIENPGATDQGFAECDMVFLTVDSLLPGDTVSIGTSLWGALNQGQWRVLTVGDAGGGAYTNQFTFTMDASSRPFQTSGAVAALGASAPLVQGYDALATKLYKRLLSISPSPTDPTMAYLKVTTGALWQRLGSAWGTTVTILNKLGFQTSPSVGVDGYRRQAGLLGEVARVIYGDPSDPATYPGVAAAGARVDLAGPNTRRIKVSVQVRLREGASRTDVAAAVRQAIARSINQTTTGTAVAIASYLASAESINGVEAIAPVSPTLVAGGLGDVIAVQPNEKARVLNPDTDVTVVFAGE